MLYFKVHRIESTKHGTTITLHQVDSDGEALGSTIHLDMNELAGLTTPGNLGVQPEMIIQMQMAFVG